MPGRLQDASVVVEDAPEANRLHGKGRFGRPLSGGALRLALVEAAFLVETGRLRVTDGAAAVGLAELLEVAAERQPGAEVEYLVFRDLRERGVLLAPGGPADRRREVHFLGWVRGEEPPRHPPRLWVSAWSERAPARADRLVALAEAAAKAEVGSLLALVDEESDLTYYDLGWAEPKGTRPLEAAADTEGVFLKDRVVVWDAAAARRLHEESFYGKPVAGGLQLSLVESLHLVRSGGLRVVAASGAAALRPGELARRAEAVDPDVGDRLLVYRDLRRRGLTVKTGFKFGTHFRAYEADPRKHHAPLLVHAVRRGAAMGWPQVSRAVRLSHSVRKTFLLAVIEGRRVRYVRLTRHRP